MKKRKGMHKNFGLITAQLQKKQVLLCSRMIPHGEHSEASWEKQLPFVLGTLLYN